VVGVGTPRQVFGRSELLAQYQIGTPETVAILHDLKRIGYEVDTGCYEVEEAAQEILSILPVRGVPSGW